jgi:histone acetyltransferase (RNA polymerase elongator complex component)
LYKLYKEGKYKALETHDIKYIIEKVLLNEIPAYTRIKRLIRDIPATEIAAGSTITNLSQLSREYLQKKLKTKIRLRKKLYTRLYPHLKLLRMTSEFFVKEKTMRIPSAKSIQSFVI